MVIALTGMVATLFSYGAKRVSMTPAVVGVKSFRPRIITLLWICRMVIGVLRSRCKLASLIWRLPSADPIKSIGFDAYWVQWQSNGVV